MKIRELQEMVHDNAKKHGWHDEERSFGELIALCHSELSEALEEYRNGHDMTKTYYTCGKKLVRSSCDIRLECKDCIHGKPEGIPAELADVVIRIMDMCGLYGIDLESAIIDKHQFNMHRPYRHGGKVI